jgi:hypothetical protein
MGFVRKYGAVLKRLGAMVAIITLFTIANWRAG